jgi:hypothetical protein
MIPPDGIASADPIVKADAVVPGGKPEPVMVTVLPVDTLVGSIVTTPFGIVTLTTLELSAAGVCAPFLSVDWVTPIVVKLSATFMYLVPAATPDVGIVTVPTPVPSELIGKTDVPVNV